MTWITSMRPFPGHSVMAAITLSSNRDLAQRFAQLETRLDKKLTEHIQAIAAILSAIRELMHPTPPKHRPIGFTADLEKKS